MGFDIEVEDDTNIRQERKSFITGTDQNYQSSSAYYFSFISFIVLCAGMAVLISITSATFDYLKNQKTTTIPFVTTVYPSLGLPLYEGLSWNDILNAAAGKTVNFYGSGNPTGPYAKWVDSWLIPKVSNNFNIKLGSNNYLNENTASYSYFRH